MSSSDEIELDDIKMEKLDESPAAEPTSVKRKKEANLEQENELMNLVFGNKDKLIEKIAKDGREDEEKSDSDLVVTKRKPVWHDSDDEEVKVEEGMQRSHIKSYLQDPNREYKTHLTKKFQKIVGQPKWADLDRKEEDSEDDSDNEMLKKVGHVIGTSSGTLLKNNLSYRRRKDLNRQNYAEGPKITGVEFHPNSCIALVTGSNGVASLYSVEAKNCDKLHSAEFKKFPITCSRLSKDGREAIFGSSKNYIYTFDLITGQHRRVHLFKEEITKMKDFEIAPNGEIIAVSGRFGEIHLLNATTKEWIYTLKQEHPCSSLAFSNDSKKLYCHSVENEVTIFDLRSQKPFHKFTDEGCISGRTIAFSPNSQMLATGSGEGIVNIYNSEDVLKSTLPKPIKVLANLSTKITSTKFNHSSEILGIASSETDDGVKLVHFPSGSVYANFPVSSKSIGFPTELAFSPGGRYMGVGTMNSKVALFELKHYNYF